MNKINKINRLAILKNDTFLDHKTGFCCPESSNRLRVVYDNLCVSDKIIYPEFNEVSEDILLLGHTKEMIQKVRNTENTKPKEFSILDDNTTVTCSDSFSVSKLAVGAVIKGINLLVSKEVRSCFSLVRPPGHHAERNKSMGFCLFNNIALGAKYAQSIGLKKIMVIDLDVHHGNGTQDILMNTSAVDDNFLFIDIHQSGIYPSSGFVDDIHSNKGMTINIPLSHGNDDDYASILKRIIIPVARQYNPEIILVSCGFDALQDDPMSNIALSENIYRHMTKSLVSLSKEIDCGLLYSLEGGYNPETLSSACNSVIIEMINSVDTDIIYQNSVNNGIDKAIKEIKKYWRIND